MQVKSLNCPNCGGSIPDTSKACSFCGSRVILTEDKTKFVLSGRICHKCGFENDLKSIFCSKCGEKLVIKCLSCPQNIDREALYCPHCGLNIENKIKELIQDHGSEFFSEFSDYKHRAEHLRDEMLRVDLDKKEETIKDIYRKIDVLKKELPREQIWLIVSILSWSIFFISLFFDSSIAILLFVLLLVGILFTQGKMLVFLPFARILYINRKVENYEKNIIILRQQRKELKNRLEAS